MSGRTQDSGVVLVNVLVLLAIAGGLMVLLISGQERTLDRISASSDAAIAEQIALGAEASVVDALRRDMDTAPETDHLNEPWALSVVQQETQLPTGRFSVAVEDLQAKFDINQLGDLSAGTQAFGTRLMTALDQPPGTVNQIVRILQAVGRISALEDLTDYGVATETVAALAPHVTALPVPGTVNLNSVEPFLLSVMMQNPSQSAQLLRLREGRVMLSLDMLQGVGALRPQNSGFTSNVYRVDILAEAGSASIALRTVLVRRNAAGIKAVDVLERQLRPSANLPPEK
ncbi:general secretion pathway protein K [Sulfitobacter noctilucae]|uniref:general secretion pathway protein GspK n=1 Tax=Sulfitobacter noctilucae TaxID=1342302 RepID=UPI00046827B7|nr:type II secretion system protein GspK [Sulfitobacter noctilucae]KIN74995.1 general secretion pathway protein K [Sulfitobacter noctilucae]